MNGSFLFKIIGVSLVYMYICGTKGVGGDGFLLLFYFCCVENVSKRRECLFLSSFSPPLLY